MLSILASSQRSRARWLRELSNSVPTKHPRSGPPASSVARGLASESCSLQSSCLLQWVALVAPVLGPWLSLGGGLCGVWDLLCLWDSTQHTAHFHGVRAGYTAKPCDAARPCRM